MGEKLGSLGLGILLYCLMNYISVFILFYSKFKHSHHPSPGGDE